MPITSSHTSTYAHVPVLTARTYVSCLPTCLNAVLQPPMACHHPDPDRLTFPLDLLLLPTALSLGGNWVLLLILLSTWVSGMYLAQSAVLRSVFVWLLSFITFLL